MLQSELKVDLDQCLCLALLVDLEEYNIYISFKAQIRQRAGDSTFC